jgi:hypothetical protein
MVCIEKDWHFGLLAQAFHQGGKLARAKKLSLAFGGADTGSLVSDAAAITAFNKTWSATLKCPSAAPSVSNRVKTSRNVLLLVFLRVPTDVIASP